MIREIKWQDMSDLIENYYSYYDELNENNGFGISFYDEKPSYVKEIQWFSDLYVETISGDAVAVVSEESGKVVGLCEITRLRPKSDMGHIGTLGIAIRKEYRGRGIGRELLKKALELSEGKFLIVKLEVFTINKGAIQLYKEMGFKEAGVIPKSIKRGDKFYDIMQMFYDLTK